jgi:hypothetical protein
MFLSTARASEFDVILRALGLLLSMITTRADDLPVIIHSEAFQYIGKAVEVRGLVFVLPIILLGTSFRHKESRGGTLFSKSNKGARKNVVLYLIYP